MRSERGAGLMQSVPARVAGRGKRYLLKVGRGASYGSSLGSVIESMLGESLNTRS